MTSSYGAWVRRFFCVAFLLALGFLAGCFAIIYSGLHDDLQKADLGVVLGNKVNPDGQPSEMLKARLNHAIYLYNQRYFHLILVSGGRGQEGYDEPVVMRHYLEAHGVDHDAIFEDNAGATTRDTAVNTAQFMAQHHLKSVLVVSQYFHMPRCRLAFSQAGIKTIYTSHAPYFALRDLYSIPREAAGYVAYAFRGGVGKSN